MERHRLPDDTILIVGAGLAGLFLAISLAPRRSLVLSPSPLGEHAASAWAQGGLAAALGPNDDPAQHAADTLAAGAGLVEPAVARLIAENGPARVLDLLELGVPFDTTAEGALSLSLEAAHSRPRVARVKGDLAGKAIMGALIAAARQNDAISVREGVSMTALLSDDVGRVGGVLCRTADGSELALEARETVLAVGGVGGLFRVTTNPVTAQGVAIAAGYTAGALIADPEFVQFHPTAIDIGRDPAPLATEALRGEGARLVDRTGRAFMGDYHPLADLAPRDVVARAIQSEISAGRGANLDARAAVGSHFPDVFPTVFETCVSAGIDPRVSLIPVAPAAHYHMGGLVTDLWGKTTAPGLSAVGECACTGAHGANRLASNSLLEAVVFARRIAERLSQEFPEGSRRFGGATAPPVLPPSALTELRERMSRHVGVRREATGVAATLEWLMDQPAAAPIVTARLIASAALDRRESRGAHWRTDYPSSAEPAARTFLFADPDAREDLA